LMCSGFSTVLRIIYLLVNCAAPAGGVDRPLSSHCNPDIHSTALKQRHAVSQFDSFPAAPIGTRSAFRCAVLADLQQNTLPSPCCRGKTRAPTRERTSVHHDRSRCLPARFPAEWAASRRPGKSKVHEFGRPDLNCPISHSLLSSNRTS
jgi:hypothetical protein